ncbi:Lrp/AsnC family transcriptional regulator [Noviherbaspirillum aerium]|uniref:Lrp/AsnC family transcriptional regulator n=1 Tax=Noviherbaspirillum aerium TaxID=2588497 RepID=UPI00124E7A73|nr:Lrp/AsnC family transcriptional regulator [Noviherbaspirillum aerium]
MAKESQQELDRTDLRILELLQKEGRLTNARLAEHLHLSETPVWRRLRRLEDDGYITGYQANLDRRKLGFGLIAFVQINFANHTGEQPAQFERAIQSIPEILSCHNVSGEADYYLQVVTRDLEAYGEFVTHVLRKLPGVTSIRSSLAMREIKSTSALPISRTQG